MFPEILYPSSFSYSGYKVTICIANMITSIVGLNKIKDFSNSLAISLEYAYLWNIHEQYYGFGSKCYVNLVIHQVVADVLGNFW